MPFKMTNQTAAFLGVLLFSIPIMLSCAASKNCVTSQQENPPHKLVGVWKLISTKPPLADGSIETDVDLWQMMKIYTESHFMFVEQDPNRARFVNGGDDAELLTAAKGFFAGAGKYTVDSDSALTEHIQIFLTPNYVNLKIKCTYRFISDDIWVQTGTLPAKALGLAAEDYHFTEVWQRVE